MSDLKLDLDQLDLLKSRIDKALTVINEEGNMAHEIGGLVGDGRFSGRIEGLSSDWNKHRYDIRDNLEWLKDSVGKINDSFTDIDDNLATSLTAPPKPAAASPGGKTNGPVAV